jgi:Ca2+/Na+ antiporter
MVIISILIALTFLFLPDIAVWVLLGILVIYDCCVVLCPGGLLRVIIEKSEERGDKIPALIYASALWIMAWKRRRKVHNESQTEPEENEEEQEEDEQPEGKTGNEEEEEEKKEDNNEEEKEEEEGIKLGLGDFVFYGMLVTRAARLGWDVVILVVFAVILGLSLTLLCLAKFQKALPALPLSLLLGFLFFITAALTFRPFFLNLKVNGLSF